MCKQNSMRQLEKSIALFSAAALVFTSVPGQAKTIKKKAIQSIQLTAPYSLKGTKVSNTLTIKKGSSFKIKTKISPKSAKKSDKLIYKSSKKKVASVSKKGVISAKRLGKTKISIKSKRNKKLGGTITVTVVKKLKKVRNLTINKKTLSLTLSGGRNSDRLQAKIVSPKKPTTQKVNWYSTNKKIVTVNKKGIVTAKNAGNAQIVVVAADGRGAKATCKVNVSKDSGKITPAPSKTPSVTSGSGSSTKPSISPTPISNLKISIPGERTGIKQGENIQLAATGLGADKVSWSVSEVDGVSINDKGLLAVSPDAAAENTIQITARTSADVKVTTASASLTVVENNIKPLAANELQLNKETAGHPLGLTYRSPQAYSTVQDPERGEVIRFDASKGYTANSYDVLAWMEVDPMFAGKTVTISAYLKYDKIPDVEKMNLIINERFKYSNPACKFNAEPDTWYYISGTYTFPDRIYTNENQNRLYICRDASNLPSSVNAVYYIDGLRFTIEKSNIDSVSLSSAGDATTIYQNKTLQFTSAVTGTNKPIQKVAYSIEPAVEGASISADGLLTVGNVPANTNITVKATSYEDETKFATKQIKVLAQTINSIDITAKAEKVEGIADETTNPTEIYSGQRVQFTADITSTGEPDESVTWSVSPATTGVTLSKTGLLSVTETVPDNTALTVKATSAFDKSKTAQYQIKVKTNKVTSVTMSSAGDKTTVTKDNPLNLSAKIAEFVGIPTKEIIWSIPQAVAGASLSAETGNNSTLSVTEDVAEGTKITVRASSVFDSTKYAEMEITVQNAVVADTFNLNNLKVEYFENFDGENTTLDTVKNDGVLSWKATEPTDSDFCPGFGSNLIDLCQNLGMINFASSQSSSEQTSNAFKGFYGNTEDYIQFTLNNTTTSEKEYELSFFFRFLDIDADKTYISKQMRNDSSFVKYKLPLKLVLKDENGTDTILQDGMQIPFRCHRLTTNNLEYYSILSTITVPAGKTVNVRLMLDGDLPTCVSPDHAAKNDTYQNTPHPVTFTIDNIAISSGKLPTLTLNAGETHQLELDTVDGDTVKYYTNSYLAQYTHGTSDTCTRFDTTVATVDDTGMITANSAGETALIAEITHTNGEVERRQCIVHVN